MRINVPLWVAQFCSGNQMSNMQNRVGFCKEELSSNLYSQASQVKKEEDTLC